MRPKMKKEDVLLSGDLTIHVKRKKMKNMYLRVKEAKGSVEVSAPEHVSDYEILRLVQERRQWIYAAQEKIRKKQHEKENEPVLVPFMERELKNALRKKISGYIAKYEPLMKVSSNGFTIKKMKTRWGSCNVKSGHLNFNFALAAMKDEYVEYVVVHELTHLLEPSHNERFWNLMEEYLPGSKQIRRELNQSTRKS